MVSVPNEDDVERSLLLWVGELGAYGTWTTGNRRDRGSGDSAYGGVEL